MQPLISISEYLVERIIAANIIENTDSNDMIIEAIVGWIFFCV